MPRNAQGQYFLPDGNPVTPGELIKSEWANSTMDDIANALTQSLDRAGAGGMTGQFKAAAGTQARPGIAFVEDVTSGIYKEAAGTVTAVAEGVKALYWTKNGAYVVTAPNSAMEIANKGYVDQFASQATEIMGKFGQTKTPSDLPPNGYIPANWDASGVPQYAIQMAVGQSLVYQPTNTADPLYDNVYIYVGVNFIATGWINIGKVQGPPGPQGEAGAIGPQGPEGPTGPAGPAGQTGAMGPTGPTGAQGPQGPQGTTGEVGPKGDTGPQGPQGIQGVKGDQGIQGSPGASAVIVGTFGASKTPADLPVSGLIPANWDSPGNPPADYQMKPGEALIYTDVPKTDPLYGHVYEYVPDSVSEYDLNNWVDLGDIVGPQGAQGIQGEQGPQGATGPTGPQGPKGDDGGVGPQGPQGAVGPQGPAGADGGQGPEGPQGPAGPTGPQGNPGAQGPAGPAIVGMISMFAGAEFIPGGWHICDGTAGTVDLRDKFIVAGGGTYPYGSTGGSTSVPLVAHTHQVTGATASANRDHSHDMGTNDVTLSGGTTGPAGTHSHGVSDPGHVHNVMVSRPQLGGSSGQPRIQGGESLAGCIASSGTGIGIQAVGDHTHSISGTAHISGSTGGMSATHEHDFNVTSASAGGSASYVPPYYAMVFAQYTGV